MLTLFSYIYVSVVVGVGEVVGWQPKGDETGFLHTLLALFVVVVFFIYIYLYNFHCIIIYHNSFDDEQLEYFPIIWENYNKHLICLSHIWELMDA